MSLDRYDFIFIAAFFAVIIFVAIKYSKRAGESLGEFFLSGRKLPWYIAGFSMVATTFAADTPLAVTEIVNKNGIAGNWLWWNMLIGGMLTVFFFAKYWRRANIMTDVEFIELRYGGKPAAFLRGFRAIYLGVFMNAIIMGWINVALATIIHVFFDIPVDHLIWYVAAAMIFTATYSSLSGLWGVAINDFIQFIIAMTGCIALAIVVIHSDKIGGISGLQAKLPKGSMNFLPNVGEGNWVGFSLGVASFFAFVGVQWWASWYPGAEPGGGGYVAQRMMSAKDEKNSLWATLFFQVAHYCIRPWPWILVGLATIVLYPQLGVDDKKLGFVMAMRDFLPSGLRGLLLVTFLAAYMSSISSQLNWSTSYFINDLYKRFIRKDNSFSNEAKAQKHYVLMSRIYTMIVMLFALFAYTQITSISAVWKFVFECGAGLGLVLILRWYWWRINAWSEITATIVPFIVYGVVKVMEFNLLKDFKNNLAATNQLISGEIPAKNLEDFYNLHPYLHFPYSFLITVAVTTVCWILITFITRPEKTEILQKFYQRIQPQGVWKPVRTTLGMPAQKSTIPFLLLSWISAIVMTYSMLFTIGKIIFGDWTSAIELFALVLTGFLLMRLGMKKAELL
jgi:solute:Na+ symporter, SSS family